MEKILHRKRLLTSSQIILIGFMLAILTGAFILMLPFSSANGSFTPFLDALFTATSAVCVTGLIVHDTATYWSSFGQFIILLLIQIGGMGVVTLSIAVVTFTGKKIGLKQRSLMQEAISAPQVGGIIKLTGFILKGTFLIELTGAILMFPFFLKEFGFPKSIWYSIFHSISAFCNAGFDLMGKKSPYSSLTSYSANWGLNLIVILLITIGGLGFLVWNDIVTFKTQLKRYRMQSKVVLMISILLVVFPALYYFIFEFSEAKWSAMSLADKGLASLFQAVTPRTAGFNTVDLSAFSESGQLIMIFLMLIGGSPGSTAGGMKTTTIAVLFGCTIAVFRRKESPHFFQRRIPSEVISNAATILVMYLVLFLTGGIIICRIESLPLLTALFETASAVGTVGLTLGVTPSLCTISRCILILLMYIGRVGGLTIIFAAVSGNPAKLSRLPQEKITVG